MPSKPISASKHVVQDSMRAFEKALKQATAADGSVDMKTLRKEAGEVARGKDLHAVFDKSIDVLESTFQRSHTVQGSCGSSIVHEAPKALKPQEVRSVFAALVEAKSKGLDKIDKKPDGIITPEEAAAPPPGHELADKLASAAAKGVTHPHERKPRDQGGVGC